MIFAFGAQIKSIAALYLGRFIAGTMYEAVDMLHVIIVVPLLPDDWGIVVGICNAFLRLGSVSNFIISPLTYRLYGVAAAFWVLAVVAASGILFGIGTYVFERKYISFLKQQDLSLSNNDTTPEDIAASAEEEVDDSADRERSFTKILGQLRDLGVPYHLYATAGAFLYGAMVPFWFIGSKYLQDTYHIDVSMADALVLLPEGLIVLIGAPVGYLLDRYQLSTVTMCYMLAASIFMLPLCYMTFYFGGAHVSPVAVVALLGLGYGCSNCVFWTVFPSVFSAKYRGIGTGLLSCLMNLLPSVVPPFLANVIGETHMRSYFIVLAVLGCVSSLCAVLTGQKIRSQNSALSRSKETLHGVEYAPLHTVSSTSSDIEMVSSISSTNRKAPSGGLTMRDAKALSESSELRHLRTAQISAEHNLSRTRSSSNYAGDQTATAALTKSLQQDYDDQLDSHYDDVAV